MIVLLAAPGAAQPAPASRPAVTGGQVGQAVDAAVAWIQAARGPDGAWPEPTNWRGGHTALALLALLNAGVDPRSPAIQNGLAHLLALPSESTYVVSLKCMVLAAADPQLYRPQLTAAARWLADSQQENGTWNYSAAQRGQDNSNTQFALMGLHEAAKAGVEVDARVWLHSQAHFHRTQLGDGGWTYRLTGPPSRDAGKAYGSMTCAGLACLFITGEQLLAGREKGYVEGGAYQCGHYGQSVPIARGLAWLEEHFRVDANPGHGGQYLHYYLYSLERVGMTGGLRYIGRHDWYRLGAAHLVDTQRNGAWGNSLADTCLAVLFLAKGIRPLLIQKLQWNGAWNPDRRDAANLVEFIGDRLGKGAAWGVAPLSASVEDWSASPILYIQGHEFPRFTDADVAKLRQYVDAGGTLVFEACCSRPAFAEGFRALARRAFGDYPLRALSLDHPVFHAAAELDRTHGLMGIDAGCRTSVFFLPQDVSCLWEQRDLPTPQNLARFAFELGLNLAAYATGSSPLGDRLTQAAVAPPATRPAAIPAAVRGAVQIARLMHGGDATADPRALVHLAELAARSAAIDVISRERPIDPADAGLFDHPVLFMTGHFSFTLSEAQLANLATHLSRGGVLIAEACCGAEPFDAAFTRLAANLIARIDGAEGLAELPADHALFAAQSAAPLGTIRLRPALGRALGRQTLDRPRVLAATLNGRAFILYSPHDWTCGLERDKPYACRGYADEDAARIGLALLLYAVSN